MHKIPLVFLTIIFPAYAFCTDFFEEDITPASGLLELSSQGRLLSEFIKKLDHNSLTLSDVLEMQSYYARLGELYEEGHKKEGQRITLRSIMDNYQLPSKHSVYYCCDSAFRIGERARASNGRRK